jgi:hypothetical protein
VEKYDVMDPGRRAGGGEYPAQDGFGWTNGVALALVAEARRSPDAGNPREQRSDRGPARGVPRVAVPRVPQ